MLTFEEILELHEAVLRDLPGDPGILNENNIHSAINQPHQTFDGVDLYVGPVAKAAALGYFLSKAHGFVDGNKRVGYLAMKVALFGSGYRLKCDPDDGEFIILAVVEGEADLTQLTEWVEDHIEPEKRGEVSVENEPFISPEGWEIEKRRPSYWRTRLFVQVLSDEMSKCSISRLEHLQSISTRPKRQFTRVEFFPWLTSELNQRGDLVVEQSQVIGLLSDLAFINLDADGNYETEGNLDHMVTLAVELSKIYSTTILWSQQFREIEAPDVYAPLLDAMAHFFDNFIDSMEQVANKITTELDMAEKWEGPGPYQMFIEIDFSPTDGDRPSKEIQILLAKDDDDLLQFGDIADQSSIASQTLWRMTRALFETSEITRLQASLITKFGEVLARNTVITEAIASGPRTLHASQAKRVYNDVSAETFALASGLQEVMPRAKIMTIEIGKCIPILIDSARFTTEEELTDGANALIGYIDLTDNIEYALDRLSEFQDSIVRLQGTAPALKACSSLLVEALSDMRAIYNENWFSYYDLIQDWKKKI